MSGWRGKRGIEHDFFSKSVYCAQSDNVVAQFYSVFDRIPLHGIYVRRSKEEDFQLLTPYQEGIDYRDFLVSQTFPLVFVNSYENLVRTEQGQQVFCGNWDVLQEFDLNTGESKIIYSEQSDINNHLTDRRIWINNVVGYDAVNNDLFLSVVIEKELKRHHVKAEYWLSKINRENGKIDLISLFPSTFF